MKLWQVPMAVALVGIVLAACWLPGAIASLARVLP